MTTGSSVPDELIRLSINRSWLRATEELEDEVAAAAEEVHASPEAAALALWLLASPAAGRQPGPALPVLRFCAWFCRAGDRAHSGRQTSTDPTWAY